MYVIDGLSSYLKFVAYTNMASWETIVCTYLEKSKMATKLCAKGGFQTFSGIFHYGSLPNFTNSFMDVKIQPNFDFGQIRTKSKMAAICLSIHLSGFISMHVIDGLSSYLKFVVYTNVASWETIVCTYYLEKSKMAAKLCAKSSFQTFLGTFHYGSLPNFTDSFMDVKYSPSSILGKF
jgi:hypothetical protein